MSSSSLSPLSSRQHPLIKKMRALQNAKDRRESGLFLIEGRNAVEAALKANWALHEIVAELEESQVSPMAQQKGLLVTKVTSELLAYACDAQSSPQIAAIGELPPPVKDFDLKGLLLIIDGVSDPGNIGTLLRAADAAGIEKVVLTTGSADAWSPKVVRSAAGSLFSLPPLALPNRSPETLAALLNAKKIPLISAEAHGGTNCFEFDWPQRAALILGHETRGISEAFAREATAVTIPIWGRAESLNVAMAGTLLLYACRNSVQNSVVENGAG